MGDLDQTPSDLDKKLHLLETISEYARSLSTATSLKQICDAVMLTCMGQKGIEVTAILIAGENDPFLFQVKSTRGLKQDLNGVTIKFSQKIIDDLIAGQHYLILEKSNDPAKELKELESRLLMPIMYHSTLNGILSCSGKISGMEYLQEDISFLQLITIHAGIAINNIWMLEKQKLNKKRLERKIFELEAMDEVNSSMAATLEPEEVCNRLLLTILGYLTAESGIIFLADRKNPERLEPIAHTGIYSFTSIKHIHIGPEILPMILDQKIFYHNKTPDIFEQIFTEYKMTVCFPIKGQKQIAGLCLFGAKATGLPYKQQELDLAGTLVQQGLYPIRKSIMYQEIEQRVIERTAQLEAVTRAKSQFLANMSHEIRTPMNGIITASDLALGEDQEARIKHYLKIINTSGHSLMRIINDILDFSKIEAGKLELESAPFYLDTFIDNIVDSFISNANEKEIELLVDLDPGIPLKLVGDSLRIQQVITNLLSNAIKFTNKNGAVSLSIRNIAPQNKFTNLEIAVKDTGIGIAPEAVKELFKPFSQADASTTRQFGGTGLGLTICKQLVDKMGGKLWVKSSPGKGSTFFFTLTLTSQPKGDKKRYLLPKDIAKLKVLIVDDNSDSLVIIQKLLESFGCTSESLGSGEDALARLSMPQAREFFDLIIIDSMMPKISGIETVQSMRKDLNIKTPIILMTIFGKQMPGPDSQERGANTILYKPVKASSLYAAVLEVFGRKKLKDKSLEKENSFPYQHSIQGIQVLLAEDNLINQQIARAVLDKAGVNIVTCNNGKEAVRALGKKKYDLVLMDIQMPEMDGYEATRIIRKNRNFAELPIIAMTAHAMKGDEEKCLSAGMNGYITKPIDQKILFKTLWEFTRSKAAMPLVTGQTIKTKTLPRDSENILPSALPGMNIDDALKSIRISKQAFKKILISFFHNHEQTSQQFKIMSQKQDWQGIFFLAHKIKGTCTSIGAHSLLKATRELESACMKTDFGPLDTSLIKKLVSEVIREFDQVMASLCLIAGSEAKEQDNNTADLKP